MKNVVVFVVVLYKQTNLYYMFKLLIHLCLLHISYAHLSDLKNIEYVVLKNKKYNNFDILNIVYDNGKTKLYEIGDNVKLIYKQKLKNTVEVDYCKTGNAGVKINSTCYQLKVGEQCPIDEPPDCEGRCNGSNMNCATMYGYATVWNGSTCVDSCIKWRGTIGDDFREYKTQMVTNPIICSLLKNTTLLISECCSSLRSLFGLYLNNNPCTALSSSNECDQHPCNGHGTCTNLDNSYTCSCYNGYYGINCENVYSKNGCVSTNYTLIKPLLTGTYTIKNNCTLTNEIVLNGNLEIIGNENNYISISGPKNAGETLDCKCIDTCNSESWCYINGRNSDASKCIGATISDFHTISNNYDYDKYWLYCTIGVDDVAANSRHFHLSKSSHILTLKWVILTNTSLESGKGGAIEMINGHINIISSMVINNIAKFGGFIHMSYNASSILIDDSFIDNDGTVHGDNFYIYSDVNSGTPNVTIVNSEVAPTYDCQCRQVGDIPEKCKCLTNNLDDGTVGATCGTWNSVSRTENWCYLKNLDEFDTDCVEYEAQYDGSKWWKYCGYDCDKHGGGDWSWCYINSDIPHNTYNVQTVSNVCREIISKSSKINDGWLKHCAKNDYCNPCPSDFPIVSEIEYSINMNFKLCYDSLQSMENAKDTTCDCISLHNNNQYGQYCFKHDTNYAHDWCYINADTDAEGNNCNGATKGTGGWWKHCSCSQNFCSIEDEGRNVVCGDNLQICSQPTCETPNIINVKTCNDNICQNNDTCVDIQKRNSLDSTTCSSNTCVVQENSLPPTC